MTQDQPSPLPPSTLSAAAPQTPASEPPRPVAPLYEIATDDWRVVTRPISYQRQTGATAGLALHPTVTDYADAVVKVQRRYRVQCSPLQDPLACPPMALDKGKWVVVPGRLWCEVRDEWRDLPAISHEQAASEAQTPSTNA